MSYDQHIHVHNHHEGAVRMIQNIFLGFGAIWMFWIFIVVVTNYPLLVLGALLAVIAACVLVLPHILRKQPKKDVCPVSGLNPCPWHPEGGPHPVSLQ